MFEKESDAVQAHLKKHFSEGPRYIIPVEIRADLNPVQAIKLALDIPTLAGKSYNIQTINLFRLSIEGPLRCCPEIFFKFCIFKLTNRWQTLVNLDTFGSFPKELHQYRKGQRMGDMISYWDSLFYDSPSARPDSPSEE